LQEWKEKKLVYLHRHCKRWGRDVSMMGNALTRTGGLAYLPNIDLDIYTICYVVSLEGFSEATLVTVPAL